MTGQSADPVPAGRTVVWFELWVPDLTRAKEFYGSLFGWQFRPMPEYDESRGTTLS